MIRRAAMLCLVAGCTSSPATEPASVIGGAVDPGDAAVVLVELAGGLCSGALVAPRVVLTAAHCARPALDLAAPGVIRVGTQAPWDDTVEVVALHLHRASRALGDGPDLALVRLARDAAPAPLALRPDSPVGEPALRVIGFGLAIAGDPDSRGIKRDGLLPLTGADGTVVIGGGAITTCQGDSGGPALDGDGRLAAVISAGDAGCTGSARLERVDLQAAWIAEVIAAWDGACAADGGCQPGCAPWPDPDCEPCGLDGTCAAACPRPDLDCPLGGQPGADCDDGFACESRRCVRAPDDATVSFCSADCDPVVAGADCPPPLAACLAGACVYDGPTAGALGAPCTGDDDCRAGLCDPGSGACATPCVAGACPAGFACEPLGGGRACVRDRDGCAAGGGAGRGWLVLALLAAAVGLARRPARVRSGRRSRRPR